MLAVGAFRSSVQQVPDDGYAAFNERSAIRFNSK